MHVLGKCSNLKYLSMKNIQMKMKINHELHAFIILNFKLFNIFQLLCTELGLF